MILQKSIRSIAALILLLGATLCSYEKAHADLDGRYDIIGSIDEDYIHYPSMPQEFLDGLVHFNSYAYLSPYDVISLRCHQVVEGTWFFDEKWAIDINTTQFPMGATLQNHIRTNRNGCGAIMTQYLQVVARAKEEHAYLLFGYFQKQLNFFRNDILYVDYHLPKLDWAPDSDIH